MSVRPIPSSDIGSVVAHGRLDRVGACPGQQAIQIPAAQVLESQPILESEVQDVHRGAAILPEKFDEMSFARVGLILASLGLCTFLYAIEQTIVATAVSDIGVGVKATGSLTWITTSYLLTTTVLQPITGRLSDAFGTNRMLLCEVWVFIIGNIIAGTARNLPQLVAGRLLAGVGGAGILSLCTIIVSQLTHERQRSSYLNLINAVFIVADSLGPIIGGVLAKSGNWRWIFLLNAPVGTIITAVLIYAVHIKHYPNGVPERSQATIKKLDLLGMTLLICWLTLLIVALNLGGDAYPWASSVTISLFAAAGCAFAAFVIAENYATHPVIPMGLFVTWHSRNVPIITVARTLLFFHLFATTFYLPIFLQVTGKSSVLAAALVIPFLLTAALSSIAMGHVATKFGLVRPPFLFGLAILPVGMGLMSTIDERTSLGKVVGYTLICGLGFGAGTQTSMIIPQVGLSEDLLPTVTAFISATPNLGGVLGVGIIGTVINSEFRSSVSNLLGSEDVPQHINDAVTAAMDPITGPEVITAYIGAFRLGFRILAGIAAFQFVLCLALGKVVLSGGKPEILDVSPTEDKVALERPGTVTQTEKDVGIEEVTRET